jgi:hypothetical protein
VAIDVRERQRGRSGAGRDAADGRHDGPFMATILTRIWRTKA